MRKLLLASVAVFALSSAAQAADAATTVQIGLANGSTVNQQGHVNNFSTTFQLGIVNSASTMQGTTSPSLNNPQLGDPDWRPWQLGHHLGRLPPATTPAGSARPRSSAYPPNNSAGVGQLGRISTSAPSRSTNQPRTSGCARAAYPELCSNGHDQAWWSGDRIAAPSGGTHMRINYLLATAVMLSALASVDAKPPTRSACCSSVRQISRPQRRPGR